MSAIGKGDWVQVVHAVDPWFSEGDVLCVEDLDQGDSYGRDCPFDGCHIAGLRIVGIPMEPYTYFCANRFRPLGGGATKSVVRTCEPVEA